MCGLNLSVLVAFVPNSYNIFPKWEYSKLIILKMNLELVLLCAPVFLHLSTSADFAILLNSLHGFECVEK